MVNPEYSDRLHLPDYRGGGIVNLMASLTTAMGGDAQGYRGVQGVDLHALSQARHIVLLVVDGLGYDYLQGRGGSRLAQHCRARLTSVCPSTTASAIPVFLTGVAPQQHGFTGWYTYFAELGMVAAVLPFRTRFGSFPLGQTSLTPADLSGAGPLSDRIDRVSQQLMPEWIAGSGFNRAFCGNSRIRSFSDLDGMRRQLKRVTRRETAPGYSYLYWPEFDTLAHRYGVESEEVTQHFLRLDELFGRLLDDLRGSDSVLLVTADHGFIDTPPERCLRLEAHPELQTMLMAPLCGEPRLAFAYVHPHRQHDFEAYVRENFADRVALFPSRQILQEGWFGIGAVEPRLEQRIGHYALVMRDNWIVMGTLPGEREPHHIGVHGGLSSEEMYVPLIVAEC